MPATASRPSSAAMSARRAAGSSARPAWVSITRTAVAHEQRGAHLAFERVDRRAQAGLDHVHPGRGTGEMQFLRDRDEVV